MDTVKITEGVGYFQLNDTKYPKGKFVATPFNDDVVIKAIGTVALGVTAPWEKFRDKNNQAYGSQEAVLTALELAFRNSTGGENLNSKDAFGLLETASPQVDFDAQLTYDDQPLLYDKVESNGAITYDATDGVLVISNESLAGTPYVQTFDYFPYRPGIGKKVFITFNFEGSEVDNVKYAQYGDDDNAIGLRLLANGTLEGYITTETTQGNQVSPPISISTIGIDVEAEQIMIIQFAALYVGSVQIGLQISGSIVWLALFDNANRTTRPYMRTANLPVRVGIISTGTTPATMVFNYCSVQNSGGSEFVTGFDFTTFAEVTAGNGVRTHALSVRPKLLFKERTNRVTFIEFDLEINVRGNHSIRWELSLGQALTDPVYADLNATYSAMEFVSGATMSGTPAIIVKRGTVLATNQNKTSETKTIPFKYPITLGANGAHRDLGTLTLTVEGLGSASLCDVYINHREVR
jgi:hypothetical protein